MMGKILITGGNVLDVRSGSRERADILVEERRIAAVGRPADFGACSEAATVDATGLTVLPGFVNNHVHVGWSGMGWDGGPTGILRDEALHDSDGINGIKAAANLRKSLCVGLTALRDLGMNNSAFDAKEALRRGLIAGPRLFIAGKAIMCSGGHTWWCGQEADGVDAVRAAVRQQVKRGADHIKVIANEKTPQYTVQELQAAADEAHRWGRRITAHASIAPAIRNVVEAGFDSIEHGGPAEDEVIARLVDRRIMVVPTFSPRVLQTERGPARGMPPDVAESRRRQAEQTPPGAALARMREAGVKFAFGTDAGSPCVPHDEIMGEIEALLKYEAVRTPLDVIQMLTINSAELRGDADRLGTVETGKLADIVIIDGDPTKDVHALGRVRHVFVDGKQLVDDGVLQDWYSW
jgi:imidazolonepropionase-like amidohydrolase